MTINKKNTKDIKKSTSNSKQDMLNNISSSSSSSNADNMDTSNNMWINYEMDPRDKDQYEKFTSMEKGCTMNLQSIYSNIDSYFNSLCHYIYNSDFHQKFKDRLKSMGKESVANYEHLEFYLLALFYSFIHNPCYFTTNYIQDYYNFFVNIWRENLNETNLTDIPDLETFRLYHSQLYFHIEDMDNIMTFFHEKISNLGTYMVCDRLILNKNNIFENNFVFEYAQTDVKYLESVITTKNGFKYIYDLRFKPEGEEVSIAIDYWINLLKEKPSDKTILIFTGFFSSESALKLIRDNNINTVCSIRKNVLGSYTKNELSDEDFKDATVSKPVIKINKDTNETICGTLIEGKKKVKYAYSNLLEKFSLKPLDSRKIYLDHYKHCQTTNRKLNGYNSVLLNYRLSLDNKENLEQVTLTTKIMFKLMVHNLRVLTMEKCLHENPKFKVNLYNKSCFIHDLIGTVFAKKNHLDFDQRINKYLDVK